MEFIFGVGGLILGFFGVILAYRGISLSRESIRRAAESERRIVAETTELRRETAALRHETAEVEHLVNVLADYLEGSSVIKAVKRDENGRMLRWVLARGSHSITISESGSATIGDPQQKHEP